MIALVCPGQGSQTPGFLAPWLELPGLRARAEALSDAAGVDLVAHGTTSDADTIHDTAVAQPLIVGAGLLALDALYADSPDTLASSAGVVAGHSVGEITAAAATGVLTPQDAMSLVSLRGRAMAEASAITPTGMSAVLGGDPAEVADALERHGLTPANINGAGQVVAAGTLEQLAAFAADPPAKARVIPLQVAGAFHTVHMASAVEALDPARPDHDVSDPGVTLLSNADGTAVASGAEVLRRTRAPGAQPGPLGPVHGDDDRARRHRPRRARARRHAGRPGQARHDRRPTVALKTPDDLDAARELLAATTSLRRPT